MMNSDTAKISPADTKAKPPKRAHVPLDMKLSNA
jgi:hypothetical protein